MTKQNLETEYCNERGDSSFNDYNNNDYTKWLETKLIETEKQLTLTDVVGQSEQLICDTCKSGLIDYPEIPRRTCRCGRLGYNVTD